MMDASWIKRAELCRGCVYGWATDCQIHCGISKYLDITEENGHPICKHRLANDAVELLDSDTVTNERGAKQSRLLHEWLDFDPATMLRIAEISATGKAKYGPENWRNISREDHINHAITHIYKHLAGDTAEEHLSHAVCRLIFAMGVEE